MTVTLTVRQTDLVRRVAVRRRAAPVGDVFRPLGHHPVSLGDVQVAVGLFPPPAVHGSIHGGDALQARHDGHGLAYAEGRTFELLAAPGCVQLRVRDMAREDRRLSDVDDTDDVTFVRLQALRVRRLPLPGFEHQRVGTVVEWSRKSRARMARTISQLDLAGWAGTDPLGMVTLTYPGDWQAVAPSGAVVKRHLRALRWRFERAYGRPLSALWKLEFQRRGAPHFHLLMRVPALAPAGSGLRVTDVMTSQDRPVHSFEEWLSQTWADVVGAEGAERLRHVAAGTGVDFSARMTDPKRIAVYFGKHGAKTADDKEYQHVVPMTWRGPGRGPGRFWGHWGLGRAVVPVELDLDDWLQVRRVLRRSARSAARRRGARLRTLGAGGQLKGGFVLVNDGAALTSQLARWVVVSRSRVGGRDVMPTRHVWP